MDLGRLEQMDLRDVWEHEAHRFTPWLAGNIDRLSEALGLELTVDAQEQSVGRFAADIFAHDAAGRRVVIENMLAASDHGHLGQLVTYAAGLEASFAVLVAPEFREEHRSALSWLNDISGTDHGFFGVEVRAVRIGNSVPAPLFDVVVRPDDWQRHVRETAGVEVTATEQRYLDWWEELLPRIRERYPGWTSASTGSKTNWQSLPAGRSGVHYTVVWGWSSGLGYHLRVEFYMHDGALHYPEVAAHRAEIDPQIEGIVEWDDLPDAKAARVAVYLDADADDREAWPSYQAWVLDRLGEFRSAFQSVVTELS